MSLRLLVGSRGLFCQQFARAYAAGANFLKDVPLKNREGEVFASAVEGKAILLYFSAGWCGHCRLFTPKLKKWFEEAGKGNGVEVVWVSRDRSAEDQVEYYKKALPEIPYIPFGDEHIPKFLRKYRIVTIPAVKLVNSEGEVIDPDVRKKIETQGKEDPKKLAKELLNAVSD